MTPNAAPAIKYDEVSASEAGKRLGLTKQAIGLWCVKPGAPVRKDGIRLYLRWPQFARWREETLLAKAVENLQPVGFDAARTRKALAEAELAEIEVAKARGLVVTVPDYESSLARILERLTARLRALPVRFQHLGPEVEEAMEIECQRVVDELNQWDEDAIDELEPELAA